MTRFTLAALGCVALASFASRATDGGWGDKRDRAVGLIVASDGSFCSGTVVGRHAVLTAGHCIGKAQYFYIGRGDAVTTGFPNLAKMDCHAVTQQAAHPSFAGGCKPDDFGLLLLSTPIDSQIPSVNYGHAIARKSHNCDSIKFNQHLLKDKKTYNYGEKRRTSVQVTKVDKGVIEAKWATGIADHGDSGGPLYCSREGAGDYIYGVVSCHTDGEGAGHRREVFADVTAGRKWIDETLEKWQKLVPAPAHHKK